jgi:hypothetical protein
MSDCRERTIMRSWLGQPVQDVCCLPHDQATVPKYAYERMEAGLPMPGVFVGDTHLPIQQAINDILLLVERSEEHAWEGQGRYLPS